MSLVDQAIDAFWEYAQRRIPPASEWMKRLSRDEAYRVQLGGYPAEGATSANYNNLVDPDAVDPISGTVALRSYVCQVRRGEP